MCGLLGFIQGSLITRLGLPSFVVTLGGYLGFLGLMLELAHIDKTAVGGVDHASTPTARCTSSSRTT